MRKCKPLGLSGIIWAMKLPRYSWLRLFNDPHSDAEARFHAERRVQSIADSCGCSLSAADHALSEAYESEVLKAARDTAAELPWVGVFRASPELYAICRLTRPSVVVETGVGYGLSSVHILEALRLNGKGRLFSVDLPNTDPGWKLPADIPPGFLVPKELRDRWSLIIGDTRVELNRIYKDQPAVDIFFHDSEHTYDAMYFEFSTSWPHLRTGGLLLADDATWNSAFLRIAKQNRRKVKFLYHKGGSLPVAYVRK